MLAEIITKSNIGRQQLTKEQSKIAVGIWYEVLFGVVPEHRLNDCYLHVARKRDNSFPWKPEELCAAWSEIKASEFYKRTPKDHQLTHGFCEKCNNTGTELMRNEAGQVRGARPCTHQVKPSCD